MVAVIGDIHGCYNTLVELVKKIREKYHAIQLYCVGDLVDRGNFSYEVIEFIITENIRFTPGNHDYMFYHFIKEPQSQLGRAWLYNGSEPTISSYENRLEKLTEHLDAIISAPLFINLNDCFISHAGISQFYRSRIPQYLFDDHDALDTILKKDVGNEHGILWTRDKLINIGKLQVVGHTRQEEINFSKSGNALYIDTSVYTGNKLSAAIIDNGEVVESFSVPTFIKDID